MNEVWVSRRRGNVCGKRGRGEGLEVVIRLPAGWSGTSLSWQQIGCTAPGGGRSPPVPVPSALLPGREAALCVDEDNKRAAEELLKHHISHNPILEIVLLPILQMENWGRLRHWAKSTGEVIGRLGI